MELPKRQHINLRELMQLHDTANREYLREYEQVEAENRRRKEAWEEQDRINRERLALQDRRKLQLRMASEAAKKAELQNSYPASSANTHQPPVIDWAQYENDKRILRSPLYLGSAEANAAAARVKDVEERQRAWSNLLHNSVVTYLNNLREMLSELYSPAKMAQREFKMELLNANPWRKDLNGHLTLENTVDRLSRRIWQNNTLGLVSKGAALTRKEQSEIINFRLATDPVYTLEFILEMNDNLAEYNLKLQDEANAVKKPDNYFGNNDFLFGNTGKVLLSSGHAVEAYIANYINKVANSLWAKDYFSKWILSTNESQAQYTEGLIDRSNELLNLANDAVSYTTVTQQYAENLYRILLLQLQLNSGVVNSLQNLNIQQEIGRLLLQNDDYRKALSDGKLNRNSHILASWGNPSEFFSWGLWRTSQAIDGVIDTDLGGIRGNLENLGPKLDYLNSLMQQRNHDAAWAKEVTRATKEIQGLLSKFSSNTNKWQNHWRKQNDEDYQDIADWLDGNNWLGFHAKTSDYYNAQERLLQMNNYSWSDPVKMALFGSAGVAGGSNSSWWKSIISTAANIGGWTFGGPEKATWLAAKFGLKGLKLAKAAKKVSMASLLLGTGISFEANKAAGSDENNIESANRARSNFIDAAKRSGIYDEIITEGLGLLIGTDVPVKKAIDASSDKDAIEQYIIGGLFTGAWHSTNPDVAKMQADAIVGSNNLFYSDQPVNTADAAIDAVVWTARIAPIKLAVLSAKVYGRLGRRAVNAELRASARWQGFAEGLHGAARKVVQSKLIQDATKVGNAVKHGVQTGLGWAAKGVYEHTFGRPLGKLYGFEHKIANGMAGIRAWATKIPSAYLNATSTAKTLTSIANKKLTETASESLQEGIQGINSYDNRESINKITGINVPNRDPQENRPMGVRVLDDILTGAQAALMWLNRGDPAFQSDADVVPSMNATPLLTLFGPSNTMVAVQGAHLVHDIRLNNLIANNIDAAVRGDKNAILQYYEYAKHSTPADYDEMMRKFDQYLNVAKKHRDAVSEINARRRILSSTSRHYEEYSSDHVIPKEMIDDLRKSFLDTYNLSNSEMARALTKAIDNRLGTKISNPKKDDHARFIALLQYRTDKMKEAADNYHNEAKDWRFEVNPAKTYDQQDSKDVENLVTLYTALLMRDDYQAILDINHHDNAFLTRLKKMIHDAKESLHDSGIDVDTIDDVKKHLNNNKYYDILVESLDAAGEFKGEKSSNSIEDAMSNISHSLRRLWLTNYDAEMQSALFRDLIQDPRDQINLMRRVHKSDKQLEAMLEEDWVKQARAYDNAAIRDVKDGDIYVGDDGYWYITKRKRDENGLYKWVKHRYHPNKDEVDDTELPFDRVEYDQSKTALEEARAKKKAKDLQNQNLASTEDDSENSAPKLTTDNEVNPQLEQHTDNDAQLKTSNAETNEEPIETGEESVELPESGGATVSRLVGDDVLVHDQDSWKPGVILLVNTGDNGTTYVVNTGDNGVIENVPEELVRGTKPFTNQANYKKGDRVKYNGKRYIVQDTNVDSVDVNTFTANYIHTIQNIDDPTDILNVSDSDLEQYVPEEGSNDGESGKASGPVKPNEKLQKVIDALHEKQKADAKTVLHDKLGNKITTGHNYFIKLANRFLSFIRVHGILDDMYAESPEEEAGRLAVMNDIIALQKTRDKDKLGKRILEILDEYNSRLALQFGEDSFEYQRFKLDLSPYTRNQQIMFDPDTALAIGSIISKDIAGSATVAGSVVDEISRLFFASPDRVVENKPEYKMSDAAFALIIAGLRRLDLRFNELGWVVDTTPYTWYRILPDGRKMAGETDMVAIDRQGDIHVLDFKTTKFYAGSNGTNSRFELHKMYKTKNPLTKKESWVEYDSEDDIPEGAETKILSDFINAKPSFGEKDAKRTYAAQYARLLEAYRLMILEQLPDVKVTSLEVVPFALDYEDTESGYDIKEISKVKTYDPINLSEIPELQEEMSSVDNFLLKQSDKVSDELISDVQNLIEDVVNLLNAVIKEQNKLGLDLLNDLANDGKDIVSIAAQLNTLLNDDAKKQDVVYANGIISNANTIINKTRSDIFKAQDLIKEYDLEHTPQDPPVDPTNWQNDPLEDIHADDKLHWWQFNNLFSHSNFILGMPHYLETIIKRDFITNSEFKIERADPHGFEKKTRAELEKDAKPFIEHGDIQSVDDYIKFVKLTYDAGLGLFYVTLTYHPFGSDKIKFSKKIPVRLGNDAINRADRNKPWVPGLESKMARNLIRQYNLLVSQLKPGEYIVATKVLRTNGKLVYDTTNPSHSLVGTRFLSKDDPKLLLLINGDDSLIGFVDENGNVVEVENSDRTIILYGKYDDNDQNLTNVKLGLVPGNINYQGQIPAGTVVYLHKFKNEEDDPNDPPRTIPIALRGRKISAKEANTLVKIILNHKLWGLDVPAKAILKDGSTRTVDGIPGFTAENYLKLFIRFGEQAKYAGHEFYIGYKHDDDGKLVGGMNIVEVTDMLAEPLFETDERGNLVFDDDGQPIYHRPRVDLDITKDEDVARLKKILQQVDIHINQAGIMRANLNDDSGHGMFGSLGAFFKSEENEDVKTLKIGQLEFDDTDVLADPTNGSIGLTGIAWMIKHGIATTNAIDVSNPLISITELGISSKEKQQEQQKQEEHIQLGKDKHIGDSNNSSDDKTLEDDEDIDEPEQPDEETKKTETPVGNKKVEEISDEEALKAIEAATGMYDEDEGGADLALRVKPDESIRLTLEQKKQIEKRIRKLVGRVAIKFLSSPEVDEEYIRAFGQVLASGEHVAGLAAADGITISDITAPGAEYHESFHRILELLVPEKERDKIYAEYRAMNERQFLLDNLRNMTDRDVSEGLAEEFRYWMLHKPTVKLHLNIFKTFREIGKYCEMLHAMGGRNFTKLFIKANTGLYRFYRPSKEAIDRFNEIFAGVSPMKISGRLRFLVTDKNGKIKTQKKKVTVDLDKFPKFGGRQLYRDGIETLVWYLKSYYSIDAIASNASKLKTGYNDLVNLYRGAEKTKHSAWYRVVTGEYVQKDSEPITISDAYWYAQLFKKQPEVINAAKTAIAEGSTGDKFKIAWYKHIAEDIMAKETPETLSIKQLQLGQMMSEEAWLLVLKDINNRLHKMGVDSAAKYDHNGEQDEETDDENTIFADIEGHYDEATYEHPRSESASAAVRFMLSSIADEHFATDDDVAQGLVPSVYDKNGNRRVVRNSSNLFGTPLFLSFNYVSNQLLLKCHNVKNAKELDDLLLRLGKEDAMFARLARVYHSYYAGQILLWRAGELRKKNIDAENAGKNKISVNGKLLNPTEYEQQYDEYGQPYYIDKEGNKILNAVTLINNSYEAVVTQLFNYVATQRLDFNKVILAQKTDKDGNDIEGKYVGLLKSSSSTWGSTMFPKLWFTRFRAGISGVFELSSSGKLHLSKTGKDKLAKAGAVFDAIVSFYLHGPNKKAKINGRSLDNSDESFHFMEHEFINALLAYGIDITREQLEFAIDNRWKVVENGGSIKNAFGKLFSTKDKTMSFGTFIEMTSLMRKKLSVSGNNEIITNSSSTITKKRRGKKQRVDTGSYLYSNNAFIKFLAEGVDRYNKVNTELMTIGAEGKKLYTISEANTVSDITQDINTAVPKQTKTEKGTTMDIDGSSVLHQMMKYKYNYRIQLIHKAVVTQGSLIIKHFLKKGAGKLTLHNHAGVLIASNYSGAQSYKKISAREDYLSKMVILQNNGLIFPTLSDKSTWYYLTGVTVPGLNYQALSATTPSLLPQLGYYDNLNDDEIHLIFDWNSPNAQLDQMIEYATCEYESIKYEIQHRRDLKNKIAFWDDNRLRFGGLTEVFYYDEAGKKQHVLLNDYDKTPEKCLEDAETYFFGPNVTAAQRRLRMALTLETGFLENIAFLEGHGLILADGSLKDVGSDGKTKKANRLFQYSNVGLDDDILHALSARYLDIYGSKLSKDEHVKQRKAGSLAIISYAWDIYMRGLISTEEIERIYTGAPLFFEWKHEKIFDADLKKEMNVLVDRSKDESKRLGGNGSTGEKNRTDLLGVKLTYKCAEMNDQFVISELANEYNKGFVDNHIRDAYVRWQKQEIIKSNPDATQEQLDALYDELNDKVYDRDGETLKSLDEIRQEFEAAGLIAIYRAAENRGIKEAGVFSLDNGKPAINVTDGAAYISPEMCKTLLRMRGAYTDEVRDAFEYLEGQKATKDGPKDPLKNHEMYEIISNALLGALKYSAYGYRIDPDMPDVPIHYYDKFALFPLFECMCTGNTQALLKKMQDEHIDMLMMSSGVKTGSQNPVDYDESVFRDPEKLKNFTFAGHTYEQPFKFIRRQLNTDPHDNSETTVGTQMTKIALTNLNKNRKYKTPAGDTIRGRDLLKSIMSAINNLSDIGKRDLEDEMFSDGKLDIEKFSDFLRDELELRDADENMMDGIEVITLPDGTKDFKVPLEALSSIDWIQSILVSKINKKVIDINASGNAFYQRSVFAMEGHPTVLEDDGLFRDSEINNGETLKAVNNDGSMDAVISIDYYYDILPEGIKYNFEKSRKWLLDHNIIGQNAHADTIASRIPTQAQSSIHALRFVDVLPVVRATIVLPREFTKITGSDFDIDKLYLSRLSYRVSTYKDENGNKVDDVSTDFEDGEKKYRNQLLNGYLTLLKDHGYFDKDGKFQLGGSMQISLRSIDDDTSLIKDVLHKLENNLPKHRYHAYGFGSLAFLVNTKDEFMCGKFGIGPFALNNNNLILTLLYGVKFAHRENGILDLLKCEDLSNAYGKDGELILSWLSGYINAHVDVAKDSYITRLGVNQYTYNLVNLLTRTGMGNRTLLFTSQPVMTELSLRFIDASSDFLQDPGQSKYSRLRDAITTFILNLFKDVSGKLSLKKMLDNTLGENELVVGSYAKAIFGIDDDGSYHKELFKNDDGSEEFAEGFTYIDPTDGSIYAKRGSILEDVMTNPYALKNPSKPVSFDNMDNTRALYQINIKNPDGTDGVMQLSAKQVLLLVALIDNQLKPYTDKMSDLVNVCKIDTKKQGKNFVEQKAFEDKFNMVFDNMPSERNTVLFEQAGLDRLKNDSYVATKTDNALGLYKHIFQSVSLLATNTFQLIHTNVLRKINTSVENKIASRKVTSAITALIKKKFFDDVLLPKIENEREDPNYFETLFYGDYTLQDNLIRLLSMLRNDKKGEFAAYAKGGVITNALIKALLPDTYNEREGYINPKFVKLENALLDDSDNANSIERAWDDLYHDNKHYIQLGEDHKITFRQFAIDLMMYAFYTSGDRLGATKFFKYVPSTMRYDLGYADYMRDILVKYNAGLADENIDAIANQVIADNWCDETFVKQLLAVRFKTRQIKSGAIIKYKQKVDTGKAYVTTERSVTTLFAAVNKYKGNLHPTVKSGSDGQFPPYVKMRKPLANKKDPDRFFLYKLVDEEPCDESKEELGTYPIYELVEPTATKFAAGSYWFDFMAPSLYKLDIYFDNISQTSENIKNGFDLVIVSDETIASDVEKAEKSGEKPNVKSILLTDLIEGLKNLGISIGNDNIDATQDYIANIIRNEYNNHNAKINDTELEAAINLVKEQLLADTSINSEKKAAQKKSQKKKSATKSAKTAGAKLVNAIKNDPKAAAKMFDKLLGASEKGKNNPKQKAEEGKSKKDEKTKLTTDDLNSILGDESVSSINIQSKEYASLKNTASRPFEIDGVEFDNVYLANVYDEIQYWNVPVQEKIDARQELLNTTDYQGMKTIRKRHQEDVIAAANKDKTILEDISNAQLEHMIVSFILNDDARALLIKTGGTPIRVGNKENTTTAQLSVVRAELMEDNEKKRDDVDKSYNEGCNKRG